MVILGAGILWFGWFGFNAGSALGAGGLASSAFVVTQLGAAAAVFGWLIPEWLRHRKATTIGAASGAVAGLVAITPASGFVGPWGALAIGFTAGLICYMAVNLKNLLGYDDSLDVVGVHLAGGVVGALLTGVFASLAINAAGANGGLVQLAKQSIAVAVTAVYSFGVTLVLLKLIDRLVGLRVKQDEEDRGLDLTQHREVAYTWTERAAFPAHLVTVPNVVPLQAPKPNGLIPMSPIEVDLLGDPALD
jgi:Amt family ammonium transporter